MRSVTKNAGNLVHWSHQALLTEVVQGPGAKPYKTMVEEAAETIFLAATGKSAAFV